MVFDSPLAPDQASPNREFYDLFKKAKEMQKKQDDSHLAVDHLIAMLPKISSVAECFTEGGLDPKRVESAVKEVRGSHKVTGGGRFSFVAAH